MIGVEVKYHNAFTDEAKRAAMPLTEIAKVAYSFIVRRVKERGETASGGQFGPYADIDPGPIMRRVSQEEYDRTGIPVVPHPEWKKGFWVPPDMDQPAHGMIHRAEHGKWAGWAKYRSYRDYKIATGHVARNFNYSGQMWASMRVHMMGPSRARIKFSGRRKGKWFHKKSGKWKNVTNAWLASRWFGRETATPMQLSDAEVTRLERFMADTITASWLNAQTARDVSFDAYKAVRAADRKLKKAGKIYDQLIATLRSEVQ